mgnify:CR=1 FL=1|tara:strand:+ start:214 stop:474 length:261 start_codon:yes stop_codon:yes gene_type:complete
MTQYIDWEDMVKEYKKQYDDEGGIPEFIDCLVPVYYNEILEVFNDMTELITADDVGLSIWQVMTKHIYEAYYKSFMREWDLFDEEE